MPKGYMLVSRIPQIIQKSARGASEVNEASAKRIAEDAGQRAPRGATGDLAESLQARPADGDDWEAVAAIWRAHFTEFGTVRAPAQPFLTPAAEAERENHRKAIRELYS